MFSESIAVEIYDLFTYGISNGVFMNNLSFGELDIYNES